MKFDIKWNRAVVGNDISVQIDADDAPISRVVTTLDGFELGRDDLNPASDSYQRTFIQAGTAGPHQQHRLTVEGLDAKSNKRNAVREWQDQI